MSLDERNEQLLALLQQNARESTSSLARKLNLSRTAVHERIVRLEQSGVIAGYAVRLGPGAEQRRITAQVMIEVNPRLHKAVEAALTRVKEVKTLHTVSGQYDLIAIVQTATTELMDEVLNRIGEMDGIEKTLSSIILSTKLER